MYNKKTTNDNDTDRTTEKGLSIPRFLGNAGKEQEISSVFATILARGCNQGNESQGTVQNNWLDSVEQLAKEQGIWIDSLSSIATAEIGHGHENTVFLSKSGNSIIRCSAEKRPDGHTRQSLFHRPADKQSEKTLSIFG